jgi:hypothetical protein
MQLTVVEELQMRCPAEAVFDFATTPANLPQFLQKWGPIAGVTAAELQDGVRRVTLTDGVVLDEEILANERPSHHAYRWQGGLRPPFAWLVRTGSAEWTFRPDGAATTMVWSYVFELTSPLAAPLAALALVLFRRWMRAGLARLGDRVAAS